MSKKKELKNKDELTNVPDILLPHHEKSYLKPYRGASDNIYQDVQKFRKNRFDTGQVYPPDKYLELLEEEFVLHMKVTVQSIFIAGEILCEGRELIKAAKDKTKYKSFNEWIEARFKIKYHTAMNYINVYTFCFGHVDQVENIQPSILYDICKESFPEEFREYLFNSPGKPIDNMAIKQFKGLCKDYEENGIDSIREKLSGISEAAIAYERRNLAHSKASEAIFKISKIQKSLVDKNIDNKELFNSKIETYNKGVIVVKTIYDALTDCIVILNKAIANTDLNFEVQDDGTLIQTGSWSMPNDDNLEATCNVNVDQKNESHNEDSVSERYCSYEVPTIGDHRSESCCIVR